MVLSRQALRSALWLVLALTASAVCYLGRAASFAAAAQVVVYVGAIVVLVTLYLGGWQIPGVAPDTLRTGLGWGLLTAGCFATKVAAVLLGFIAVRWTLPRFRYDQLMGLGWKGLIPLGLANCLFAAVLSVVVR